MRDLRTCMCQMNVLGECCLVAASIRVIDIVDIQCLEYKDGKQDSLRTASESACKFYCIVL